MWVKDRQKKYRQTVVLGRQSVRNKVSRKEEGRQSEKRQTDGWKKDMPIDSKRQILLCKALKTDHVSNRSA